VVETVVKREIRTADAGVEAVSAADVDVSTLTGVEAKPEAESPRSDDFSRSEEGGPA